MNQTNYFFKVIDLNSQAVISSNLETQLFSNLDRLTIDGFDSLFDSDDLETSSGFNLLGTNEELGSLFDSDDLETSSGFNLLGTDEDLDSLLWFNDFSDPNWREDWQVLDSRQWGQENLELINDSLTGDFFNTYLRTYYPAGSVTPSYSRKTGAPIGGAQFLADLGIPPAEELKLSYYLRFSDNFDFVKGGKLPGLYGGTGNTGGNIPDGTDGFSTRFMWRQNGDGEVYAYLPTSAKFGTSLGRGDWQFVPGVWHHLEQEVILNEVGENNGSIKVFLDGVEVSHFSGLNFRSVDTLKIDGILFSTFFGGSNSTWATPNDVHIDFANFSVSELDN